MVNGHSLAELDTRIAVNPGLHFSCEGFNATSNCRTAEDPEIVLWGDSLAMHLADGMIAAQSSIKLQQFTSADCAPILGIAQISNTRSKRWADRCINYNSHVADWLTQQPTVKLAILSARLEWLTEGRFIDREGQILAATTDRITAHARQTINRLQAMGIQTVFVSPPPDPGTNVGRCLVMLDTLLNQRGRCDFELDIEKPVYHLLQRLASSTQIYWLHEDICANRHCIANRDGVFIYRDSIHLSREGSKYLGRTHNWANRFTNWSRSTELSAISTGQE